MQNKLTDSQGRPIWELDSFTLTTRPSDGVAVLQLHYRQYENCPHQYTGSTPLVSLTPEQLAHLFGAAQRAVFELKGGEKVVPFRH